MASVVGICNRALGFLGQDQIISLTEDSEAARKCNLFYEDTRDSVLRSHPWNCALSRADLALDSTNPLFGFSKQFALPTDFLRVLETDDQTLIFKIEGLKLLADTDAVKILYIKRITDPNEFDVMLIDAISQRLAADIAYSITGSRSLSADALTNYRLILAEARKADAQEGTPNEFLEKTWTDARI